ncbi:MAG: hypothetical protein AB7O86_13075 [Porticoccaceae bacterium]|jgi:hypothetical protein
MAEQRKGFASSLNRQAKAKKIQTILEQALGRSVHALPISTFAQDGTCLRPGGSGSRACARVVV